MLCLQAIINNCDYIPDNFGGLGMVGSMGANFLFIGSMLFSCSYRFDPFAQLLVRWIFPSAIGSTVS